MFKNMKIGKKLMIAFVAIALIVSIAGIMGLTSIVRISLDYNNALVTNGFVLADIGDYNTYVTDGGAIVRHIILETDNAKINEEVAKLDKVKAKANEALTKAKAHCQTPSELKVIAKIDKAIAPYQAGRDKALALALENKNDEAFKVFTDEVSPYLDECISAGQELMALNVQMGNEVVLKLENEADLNFIVISAVVIIGIIISIMLGKKISKEISVPLKEIEDVAEKMAKGDYDVEVTYTSGNEIGELAKSMDTMIDYTKAIVLDTSRGLNEIAHGNFDITPEMEYIGVFEQIKNAMVKIIIDMSDTMANIKISAEQVASGSEQVASGSQALAQGATEQASSVEELSASISEVSEQVKQSADNAASAQNVVANVGGAIHTSNEQMTNMITAMGEISQSSQEIAKIIKTIEDIAFQTNILALNAAVEAARAGAAGKGFAVVADEVRSLATKSSEAAKQTSVLIESSVKSVENGVQIADATAKSLLGVVSGAKEITTLIERISQASEEQSTAIGQINQGMEQISSVVQTNSATSEESAAASEQLNGQAGMMHDMVSKFKVKQTH